MASLLLILGIAFLILALHPFVTYPLSLKFAKAFYDKTPPARRGPAETQTPHFSLLVCAHNERAAVPGMVENRLSVAALRGAEVLIYDDASSDGTADLIRAHSSAVHLVRGKERHGKTHGMNKLAAAAQGDILVFSDANVTLAPDILERLEWHFRDPQVGCVCGHLIYVNDEDGATAATGGLYWRLEEGIKALESATGSTMGADGSLFAVRRALHRPVPEHLIDDMYLSLSILLSGYAVRRAGDVLAFERSATRAKDEFRRKVRIACQAFNVHRVLRPALERLPAFERYKYVSHKLLRWLSPFLLLGGGALMAGGVAVNYGWPALFGLIALTGCALGALSYVKPRLPGTIANIVIAFAGVGWGVVQSFKGTRYQTWTPAESVR